MIIKHLQIQLVELNFDWYNHHQNMEGFTTTNFIFQIVTTSATRGGFIN